MTALAIINCQAINSETVNGRCFWKSQASGDVAGLPTRLQLDVVLRTEQEISNAPTNKPRKWLIREASLTGLLDIPER